MLLCAVTAARATVIINFDVGVLANASGSTPVADGSLIQIIASSDNVFAAPTAGAFIGGNDVLLFSGSFDSSTTSVTGAMSISLSNLTLAQGTNLLARWFPTLTTASLTPGAGTAYGQYGSLTDVSWVSPADGTTANPQMLTSSSGFGSAANSNGYAILTVAAVPEPSTYAALFGAAALGLVAWRRRHTA